ncbi:MAG TPA: hypothetical protein VHE78_09955 [Gemmatimonadaceae bacterium]|nr:hypothetical protein [Gemmatimonadaceae bacterium]
MSTREAATTATTRNCFLAALAAVGVACFDSPTVPRSGPATIKLDLQRAPQLVSTVAVDVEVAYERTAGVSKPFFTTRLGLAFGEQQVRLAVNLTECLSDPAHAGAAAACVIDVTVSLLDASNAVLDRQRVGPLVAVPGGTSPTNSVSLFTPTQPLAVAVGFACALKTGTAYCWGANSAGQLGDGTTEARFAPVPVAGAFRFVALAAGFEAACGLAGDGIVACWGANIFGEVGDGTLTRNKSTPAPVAGTLRFKAIAAGTGYFCALTSAGSAYCWGQNSSGGLGDGTTTARLVPTPVGGALRFSSLALGMSHACGLTTAGAAYCWGDNIAGDVGDGTTTLRLSPVAVMGGLTFISLAAGQYHSCGLTSAGATYCWGLNDSGELGDGTKTAHVTPTGVAGGHIFTRIAAAKNGNGEGTTCGIAADGTLYCWGSNQVGQLGDGTLTDRLVPTAAAGGRRFTTIDLDNAGGCALTAPGTPYCWGRSLLSASMSWNRSVPTAVTGLRGVTAMSAALNHTCAVRAGGAAECWGDNTNNVLGGATSITQSSVPQPVAGGIAFSAISTGTANTCGLATSGTVYCWGSRFDSDGTTIAISINPSPIQGGLSFVAIGVGSASVKLPGQVCGATAGNAAFCMGLNNVGQVGDATTITRVAPVAVTGNQTFTVLSAGGSNTCGLTPTGAAFCWGRNNLGELGSGGVSVFEPSPVPVTGGLSFAALAVGMFHSCALTATGAAYCWGSNSSGQLGNGAMSRTPNPSPIAVRGGLTFSKIAAGAAHTCGLTPSGVGYCWGSNAFGGLGDGTQTSRAGPVAIAGGLVFAGITAGTEHSCAWTQAGAAYCWGNNATGQVGDGTSTYSLTPVLIPLP